MITGCNFTLNVVIFSLFLAHVFLKKKRVKLNKSSLIEFDIDDYEWLQKQTPVPYEANYLSPPHVTYNVYGF